MVLEIGQMIVTFSLCSHEQVAKICVTEVTSPFYPFQHRHMQVYSIFLNNPQHPTQHTEHIVGYTSQCILALLVWYPHFSCLNPIEVRFLRKQISTFLMVNLLFFSKAG